MAKSWQEKMWESLNRDPTIQQACVRRAEKTRDRAAAISAAEGGTAHFAVRTGIRPGGRFFADVTSDNRDEEFGTEKTRRIGALRRAARGG